ncbi:hypothetical protein pipiens_009204 [Culex pipiens pipiens]|uniref:Uncharacterized protein n=1 Tax=Culex pipiens pipiens TaxID=38569 RepID=A0ABD1DEN2_CULPP
MHPIRYHLQKGQIIRRNRFLRLPQISWWRQPSQVGNLQKGLTRNGKEEHALHQRDAVRLQVCHPDERPQCRWSEQMQDVTISTNRAHLLRELIKST